jgi:hypothetical protein
MVYAATTTVPVERTRGEIEQLLKAWGADAFAFGWDSTINATAVSFRIKGVYYKFRVPLPDINDARYRYDRSHRRGTDQQVRNRLAQAERSAWRATLFVIKAKKESVESGIESFEQAFLPQVMLPDGTIYGDWAEVEIEDMYATGQMPRALPGTGLALGAGANYVEAGP